ncbi:GPW/gp25 family protein [Paraburkholderia sp. BR14374]|uniref:GPW/gp25 family protein n=1 Tax=Paraburkholderia sp. BR14374 TaxID=3237007 RepID=UPI0034CE1E54
MAQSFIGTGWRFPILPDASGSLGYVSGDDNVEQSLHILLMTQLGERVMRSDFGTQAPRLVFAPGTSQCLRLLETTVQEAVRDWEPRVDLTDVRAEADPDPGRAFQATVSISYTVRQTNTSGNLVFPFYLGTVAGL